MRTKYSMTLARQRGRMAAAAKTRSPLVRDAERRAAAALSATQSKASEDPDSQVHGNSENANHRFIQRLHVLRGLVRDDIVSDASNMLERARKAALDSGADKHLVDKLDLAEPKSAVERDAEKRLFSSYGWDGDK